MSKYKCAIVDADTHKVHCVWEPDEVDAMVEALSIHNWDGSGAVVMSPEEFEKWKAERGHG